MQLLRSLGWGVLLLACSLAATSAGQPTTRVVILKGHGYGHLARTQPEMLAPGARDAFHAHLTERHNRVLRETIGRDAPTKKFYDYHHLAPGFAAALTDDEVESLKDHGEVLSVEDEIQLTPQTTYSFRFLRLDTAKTGLYTKTGGDNVIVGVLDTGVWPEAPSFSDNGMGPVPERWNGICQTGENWTVANCNKKVIGARWFVKGYSRWLNYNEEGLHDTCLEYLSARDAVGHGSNMASIAAGASLTEGFIEDGLPKFGPMRGIAFKAHLAIYKVCWSNQGGPSNTQTLCSSADIVAAMNAAVADGVDLLSISLASGPANPSDDFINHMSYTSYYANLNNIPTVFPAGNDGAAGSYTVANAAPWQLTVAASTTDRIFRNSVVLPDGTKLFGTALVNPGLNGTYYPLVHAKDIFRASPMLPLLAGRCGTAALPDSGTGMIVICNAGGPSIARKALQVLASGAAGMIIITTDPAGIPAESLLSIPGTFLPYDASQQLLSYLASASIPNATITVTAEAYGSSIKEAPFMLKDSGVGPAASSFYVLKPDITAPGNQIVAAWSGSPLTDGISQTSWLPDSNPVTLNFLNVGGTSLATAHAAGVVALLKSAHPDWTPSQIYSAIITTGSTGTNLRQPIPQPLENTPTRTPATPFNFGGGHLSPNAAADPGLVFGIDDYSQFLCSTDGGYNNPATQIRDRLCDAPGNPSTLNTPYISFYDLRRAKSVYRKVTNVAHPGTYTATVKQAGGGRMTVTPSVLNFTQSVVSRFFLVTMTPYYSTYFDRNNVTTVPANITVPQIKASYQQRQSWTFGYIMWSDTAGHKVKMNIALNIK